MKYYLLREDVQFPERWYLGVNEPLERQDTVSPLG